MPEDLVKILGKILEEDRVLSDEISLAAFSFDASNVRQMPDVVVRPSSEEEVEEILRAATEHGFPVTPRGAGTSLVGGPVPIEGGVILDLTDLNEVYEVDEEEGSIEAGPGLRVSELQERVGRDYFLPIGMYGGGSATIGGLAAVDAASSLSSLYGTMRSLVVGLRAVAPSGQWIDLRGYHAGGPRFLLDSILGSEGTLAVITRLVVRLRRRPHVATHSLELLDSLDALTLFSELAARGVEVAALDVFHRDVLEAAGEGDSEAGARALVTFVGATQECVDSASRILQEVLDEIRPLGQESLGDSLPDRNEPVVGAIREAKQAAIFVSASVPPSTLRDIVPEVERTAARYRVSTLTVSSVPLGWVTVGFLFDPLDDKLLGRAVSASQSTAELFAKSGGALGFGTGIGRTMAHAFAKHRPEAASAFAALKRVFDPAWILNPGKIVPSRGG